MQGLLGGGNDDSYFTLSWPQRIWGFLGCQGCGLLISLVSFAAIFSPRRFASLFTLGNVVTLLSTTFLVGPRRHARMMVAPTRLCATLVYFGFMACTIAAVALQNTPLAVVIFCVVCQFVAMEWYTLSYLPFGRTVALAILKGSLKAW